MILEFAEDFLSSAFKLGQTLIKNLPPPQKKKVLQQAWQFLKK